MAKHNKQRQSSGVGSDRIGSEFIPGGEELDGLGNSEGKESRNERVIGKNGGRKRRGCPGRRPIDQRPWWSRRIIHSLTGSEGWELKLLAIFEGEIRIILKWGKGREEGRRKRNWIGVFCSFAEKKRWGSFDLATSSFLYVLIIQLTVFLSFFSPNSNTEYAVSSNMLFFSSNKSLSNHIGLLYLLLARHF